MSYWKKNISEQGKHLQIYYIYFYLEIILYLQICKDSTQSPHAPSPQFPQILTSYLTNMWGPLVAHWWRIRLPMQETQVWPLGPEYSLEKKMTTHSNTFAWETPETEESGGL